MTGVVLSTPRLVIRELVHEDAPFIVQLLNDPAFLKYIGDRGVRTTEDARRYLDSGPRAMYAEFGFGLWAVELADGTPIGICGLLKRPVLDDVDLGFAMLPEFRREGYAREAASAVIAHARDSLKLDRVVAIVDPANDGSARLLGNLGFQFVETKVVHPGAPPLHLYAASLKR